MKKEIIDFIAQVLQNASKQKVVVGVSGGIDSALSLTLATQSLGAKNIIPVMLPHGEQDLGNGEEVLRFNHIPQENWQIIDIQSVVDAVAKLIGVEVGDQVRFGNLMARTRMMVIYDLAKKNEALVCGTENKSEKYLGYFTRFGDEASDLEPIVHLYKTQIKKLAKELGLPKKIIAKPPTADLWEGQTDEQELGFSYEVADQVLVQLIDEEKPAVEIIIEGIDPSLIKKVIQRVEQMSFKQQVPYQI